MRIGELVETLIRVRDENSLTQTEDTAVCAACNILDRLPNMMDTDTAKEVVSKGTAQDALMTRQELIAKVEHEIKFQRSQAGEYESGIFKNDVNFARYDQAAKILEWVLGLLKGQVEYA